MNVVPDILRMILSLSGACFLSLSSAPTLSPQLQMLCNMHACKTQDIIKACSVARSLMINVWMVVSDYLIVRVFRPASTHLIL